MLPINWNSVAEKDGLLYTQISLDEPKEKMLPLAAEPAPVTKYPEGSDYSFRLPSLIHIRFCFWM